jgi:protein TonB
MPGTGNRQLGKSMESLKAHYLKDHFAYIRTLISGNLRYPVKARRMGWSGKLTVELIVRESGEADTIRVVKSSGILLLDSDAEETVRRSSPFPKPPVSARLLIPVEYVLE